MEHATIAGNYYLVTSKNGGTVTDASGTLSEPVEAGRQITVGAPSDKLLCDDEEAIIRRANFKYALAVLGLLGGGANELPAGYVRADFLECTGSQYMLFDLKLAECGVDVKITPIKSNEVNNFAFSWQSNYTGDNGTSYRNFRWKPANSQIIWWDAGRIEIGINTFGVKTEVSANFKNNKKLKLTANGETYETVLGEVTYCPFETACWGKVIAWDKDGIMGLYYPAAMRMHHIAMSEGSSLKYDLLPALDPTGTPCMFDLVSRKPFYNAGTGQFIVGVKNASQLRTVLRKLPDLTGQDMGTLTLSIPAEGNTPEMQELLDTTETLKNWELTIQERAAEVATYSLRRVRKVVWVRRVQSEHGSYVDADGVRWQTEWCSAIYSPRGNDPTLHGYEPFDSVEQAVEAWGLVPYEYPEDELLTETE